MAGTSNSTSSPTPTERRLTVARVLGVKGLKGAVRLELLTDWPERLEPGASVWLDSATEPMRIARLELGGRSPVAHFEGIGSREEAEPLVGRYLELPARELPHDTFYWDDLIGLAVVEQGRGPIGELVEVFRAGGNEVYRVVGDTGERLVPALRSVVLQVDLVAGTMTIAAEDAEEVR